MKKISFFALFVVFSVCLLFADTYHERYLNEVDILLDQHRLKKNDMDAQDYNLAGMYFYEKELWYEAEMMFLRATQIDRNHILANYNLACVYSIQMNNDDAQHPNGCTPHESEIFFYLHQSIINDSNRMVRARNDADLNNLREKDSLLFDALTVDLSERGNFTAEVNFVDINAFESDIDLLFTDINGREYWIDAFEVKELSGYDFFEPVQRSDSPGIIINERLVGEKFLITYYYYANFSDYAGDGHIFKDQKLVAIEKI